MEKYEKVIRRRVVSSLILITIFIIINLLMIFNRDKLPSINDFILGFQEGVFLGLLIVAVFFIIRYITALKKPEILKQMYIKENDEREWMIAYKVSQFVFVVMAMLLAAGVVIAGFFNQIVFFTLVAILIVFILLAVSSRVYYDKEN